MMLGGLRIVENLAMVDYVEDWSQVRSPGRARRRRAKHKQRIVIRAVPKREAIQMGNCIFVHPEMAGVLRAKLVGYDG